MGVACEVYTKLLFKRGHGHPLWEPEPTQSGEVLIGDVGYMLDGGFYRLFNATLPADHPMHARYGVPDGYEPLNLPDILRHHRPHALQAGPICSKSVTVLTTDASLEAGTGTFGPLAHIRFKFSDEQGAVLVLKNDAHREVLHPCRDLTQYILLNHAGWHQFARNVCRLDLKSQDIIFVCGWVKTAEWALAAATHRARDGEIAFGGDFGPAGQASFSVSASHEVSMSWEHRRGPNGTQGEGEKSTKFDQCVFLHYYKVKHRPFFVPKVLRAATEEEHSSRSSTPTRSDYMESIDLISEDASFNSEEARVEVVPRRSGEGDMLDTMLDYILDQTDATCAIVSDRDLSMLSSVTRLRAPWPQSRGEIPDSLSQFLADTRPSLTVTGGVGMLPCHNVPISDSTLQHNHNTAPALPPPMVQFVAGPPRVLPHHRAWSASANRDRTRRSCSRSRSQPAARALSPPSLRLAPTRAYTHVPHLSQTHQFSGRSYDPVASLPPMRMRSPQYQYSWAPLQPDAFPLGGGGPADPELARPSSPEACPPLPDWPSAEDLEGAYVFGDASTDEYDIVGAEVDEDAFLALHEGWGPGPALESGPGPSTSALYSMEEYEYEGLVMQRPDEDLSAPESASSTRKGKGKAKEKEKDKAGKRARSPEEGASGGDEGEEEEEDKDEDERPAKGEAAVELATEGTGLGRVLRSQAVAEEEGVVAPLSFSFLDAFKEMSVAETV